MITGAPVFACDADLRIVAWNEGVEKLLGIPAAEARGRPCWSVVGGRADDGSPVCRRDCERARLARDGWPLATQILNVRTPDGPRRLAVETMSCFDRSSFLMLHVLREAPADPAPVQREEARLARLTPRQLEVLELLDQGSSARAIAEKLGLSEATVRNHIRAVLGELGAHSQLQAVGSARRQGLL